MQKEDRLRLKIKTRERRRTNSLGPDRLELRGLDQRWTSLHLRHNS